MNERNYELNEVHEMSSVEYNNESIFVTDPCYVLPEEVWDKFVDYSTNEITNAFRKLGYEKPILVDDTGYGDWSNTLFDPKTKEEYGYFGADAGMFVVCAVSDVLKNNRYGWKTLEDLRSYGAVIENFTGSVKYSFEYYTAYNYKNRLAVIEGTGNVNFRSQSSNDEE